MDDLDLEALADAIGVLQHPEPPMTWRDIAAGCYLTAIATTYLVLGPVMIP